MGFHFFSETVYCLRQSFPASYILQFSTLLWMLFKTGPLRTKEGKKEGEELNSTSVSHNSFNFSKSHLKWAHREEMEKQSYNNPRRLCFFHPSVAEPSGWWTHIALNCQKNDVSGGVREGQRQSNKDRKCCEQSICHRRCESKRVIARRSEEEGRQTNRLLSIHFWQIA